MQRSSSNRGFTLIELLIVIAMVVIVLGLFGGCVAACSSSGSSNSGPTALMTQYVNDLNPGAAEIRATCARSDSDGDGYVRCAATWQRADGTRTEQPLEAECTGGGA